MKMKTNDKVLFVNWVWSDKKPTKTGHYWYKETLDHNPSIIKVFKLKSETELSVRYGGREDQVDWLINWSGFYCGPIPLPRVSLEPIELPKWDKDNNGKVIIRDSKGRVKGAQG